MIHLILSNAHISRFPPTRANRSKTTLTKIKQSVTRFLTPRVEDCHYLNIVCLFPCLEHLQFQLIEIKSNIPNFPTQPPILPALKSVTIICNSSSPRTPGKDAYVPSEWRRFLKWVRLNGIYTIRNLYLAIMSPWSYRAIEMFINFQGTSLKHLHLRPRDRNFVPLRTNPNVNLDSFHFEIICAGASAAAADILSIVSPRNIGIIGLDIDHTVIHDSVEVENLVRLAEALKTRGFMRLRRIHVRVGYGSPKYSFTEAAKILRGIFPGKLMTVEEIPYEKRALVRDIMDDCVQL